MYSIVYTVLFVSFMFVGIYYLIVGLVPVYRVYLAQKTMIHTQPC